MTGWSIKLKEAIVYFYVWFFKEFIYPCRKYRSREW